MELQCIGVNVQVTYSGGTEMRGLVYRLREIKG